METTWVVVADQARARLFSTSDQRGPLEEVEDLAAGLHDGAPAST